MKTLRTAVVGLGRIGWETHAPGVAHHEGFELVAVVDPLEERRNEAEQTFETRGYADFAAMLDQEALDLIVIASPTHLHAEQAIAAMERGLDVFCDKPLAPTLQVADTIIEAAKRTGRKLMVYQPHRATAEVAAARHVIESGLLGPVYLIKRAWSNFVRRNDWQAMKKFGGGMLNNYGAHMIDQMLYLTQSKAQSVASHLRSIASLGDADDVVLLLLEMESGVVCTLDINMATAQTVPPWFIMGERGTATFDPAEQAFKIRYYLERELDDLRLNTQLAAAGRRYDNLDRIPWRDEIVRVDQFEGIDFYDKVYDFYAGGAAPFVPVQETREVMRVIWEARRYSRWD